MSTTKFSVYALATILVAGCSHPRPYIQTLAPSHPASIEAAEAEEPPLSKTLALGNSENLQTASEVAQDEKTKKGEDHGSHGMHHGANHDGH